MPLSRKQKEYIHHADEGHRWNFKIGAVRSGKSYVDTAFVIPYRIRSVAGKNGLNVIFGVNGSTIERNVLEPMRETFGDQLVGSIKGSRGTVIIFGEEVYCIGVEKVNAVGKIQGMSIKYAYGDEIAKWNKEAFAMIESRLDKEYSRFDGACNPEGPNHWFKKWLDNPKLDAYIQSYVIFDNPFLPKPYVESLCNEYTGTVYYERYILGKWALAEGLIYPMYQQAIEKASESVSFDKYAISIDYGTENPFAAILWAYGDDGIWYARKEYYYSGRDLGVPKTDEEYVNDMLAFAQPVLDIYEDDYKSQLDEAKTNPYLIPSRKKLAVIVDPSATSFITALQRKKKFSIKKADNDVLNGIRETAVCMKEGFIKIDPSMENWKTEADGYCWDEKASEVGVDKPVKINDHLMDSMRYLCKTMRVLQKGMKHRKEQQIYGNH